MEEHQSPHALFHYELQIEKEYLPLINDLLRMAIIQITAQMMYSSHNNTSFWVKFYSNVSLYSLRCSVYWLVFLKCVFTKISDIFSRVNYF